MLEELETGELEFETVGEFLAEIKKEFRGGEEESVKAAELRKLEQLQKSRKGKDSRWKKARIGRRTNRGNSYI